MVRIDQSEIKKQVNFIATTATISNNSLFLDSADNKLKYKDNTGTIIPLI